MDSQNKRVLDYLNEYGSITKREAELEISVANLGARINELRNSGISIETEKVPVKNKYGEKTSYAKYVLKKEQPDPYNHGCPAR